MKYHKIKKNQKVRALAIARSATTGLFRGIFLGIYGIVTFLLVFQLFSYAVATQNIAQASDQLSDYKTMGLSGLQYDEHRLDTASDNIKPWSSFDIIDDINILVDNISVDTENRYQDDFIKYENRLYTRLDKITSTLKESEDLDIEDKGSYATFVDDTQISLLVDYPNLGEVKDIISDTSLNQNMLESDIDNAKKKELLDSMIDLQEEVADMKKFFEARKGFGKYVDLSDEYIARSKAIFIDEYFLNMNYSELKEFIDSDIGKMFKSIESAKQRVWQKEEADRIAREEAERKRLAEINRRREKIGNLGGGKWIYINLYSQKLEAYSGTDLYLSTYITSGKLSTPTVRGVFSIYQKTPGRYLCGPGYCLWVDYWMPFYSGYGIHDSCNSIDCWRSSFGGVDYRWNGSHGCINTPHSRVRQLYYWAPVGTPVLVE